MSGATASGVCVLDASPAAPYLLHMPDVDHRMASKKELVRVHGGWLEELVRVNLPAPTPQAIWFNLLRASLVPACRSVKGH